MKKLLVVALAALVSACACFDCEEEAPVATYQAHRQAPMNCDYFDGKTCYRYTYRTVQHPVAQPIRYRSYTNYRPVAQPVVSCGCNQTVSSCGSCNSCDAKISETREPVEIVYKKTTTKTVYEPKTYSQVSYESAPYGSEAPESVEVIDNK